MLGRSVPALTMLVRGLAIILFLAASLDCAGATELSPFSAHYQAEWKSLNVGVSDLTLRNDSTPERFFYTWRISARGIFRLVYGHDVVQSSWFTATAGHVRPDKYRAEDGSSSVALDFDWQNQRATGVSESKSVDIKLKDGVQDVMSIQAEVMIRLREGHLPPVFDIVDKDELKEFHYIEEGSARIRTALGVLDTLVVSSQRAGGDRILRMWFAPSLGFVPVQAERTRNGKLEFAMRIKALER